MSINLSLILQGIYIKNFFSLTVCLPVVVHINLSCFLYSLHITWFIFILKPFSLHPEIRTLSRTWKDNVLFILSHLQLVPKSSLVWIILSVVWDLVLTWWTILTLLLLDFDYEHIKRNVLLILVLNFYLKCIIFRSSVYDLNQVYFNLISISDTKLIHKRFGEFPKGKTNESWNIPHPLKFLIVTKLPNLWDSYSLYFVISLVKVTCLRLPPCQTKYSLQEYRVMSEGNKFKEGKGGNCDIF